MFAVDIFGFGANSQQYNKSHLSVKRCTDAQILIL